MNPLISELIDFAMNDKVGPRLGVAVSSFGYPFAKGLSMSLCSWLRDKGRPSVSSTRLNRRVSTDMPEFIQVVPGLGLCHQLKGFDAPFLG